MFLIFKYYINYFNILINIINFTIDFINLLVYILIIKTLRMVKK